MKYRVITFMPGKWCIIDENKQPVSKPGEKGIAMFEDQAKCDQVCAQINEAEDRRNIGRIYMDWKAKMKQRNWSIPEIQESIAGAIARVKKEVVTESVKAEAIKHFEDMASRLNDATGSPAVAEATEFCCHCRKPFGPTDVKHWQSDNKYACERCI